MEHFMTSEEIADLLHVDPVTIRRLVNKSELSAYRIGADYRFAPSDLQEYLQRQRIPAQAQKETGSEAGNPLNQVAQLIRKGVQRKHVTLSDLSGISGGDRFRQFTKRARKVLTLAQVEAQQFQHNYIGTEHLLLGLIHEGEGVAAKALGNLGVELEQVRQKVEAIIGRGGRIELDNRIVPGEVELTPRSRKVIELAVDEARRLTHKYIGTEHLLLGLIREGEGIAAGVLMSFGLQLEQIRVEVIRVLGQQPGQEEAPDSIPVVPPEAATLLAEEEIGLVCASCGARCPDYFQYCFNCGQPLSKEESSSDEEG